MIKHLKTVVVALERSKDDSPWVDGAQVFTSTSDGSQVLHFVGLNLANVLTPEGEADSSLQRQAQRGKRLAQDSGLGEPCGDAQQRRFSVAQWRGKMKRLLIFIFCQRITNGGRWCPQDFGAWTRAGCQRADSRQLSPFSGADLTQSAAFRDASPYSVWLNVWFSGQLGIGAEAGLNSAVWETQTDHHVVNTVTTGQGGTYRCLACYFQSIR